MQNRAGTCLLALAPSGARINVWTTSAVEAEQLAEVLHEAQPRWRVHIDGQEPVFSREGKITALVRPKPRSHPVQAG